MLVCKRRSELGQNAARRVAMSDVPGAPWVTESASGNVTQADRRPAERRHVADSVGWLA
jgi:hypothetical protein